MAKRFFNISAIAVIFFLQASSLVYACPDFYSLGANTHVTSTENMPAHRFPCGETEKNQSSSPCYRMPDSLVSAASTEISLSSRSIAKELLTENSGLSHALLSHAPVVISWNPFPGILLIFLYQVLRI